MSTERINYPDACKFIAIFLVTCSHCAQCISGYVWTNFLGGTLWDIAFNMPLFMILSGWFINLDKLRKTKFNVLSINKIKRLIIPSLMWYIVACCLSLRFPGRDIVTFYWYLNSLFVCSLILSLSAKLIKNNVSCCIISILFVLLCPYSDFCHINFMYPFLWLGYGIRKLLDSKYVNFAILLSFFLSIVCLFFWQSEYTVYVTPFNFQEVNGRLFLVYLYRFAIGASISIVIIWFVKRYKNIRCFSYMAKFGKYSLVIYTSSLALYSPISKLIELFGLNTNKFGVIDICSILMGILLCYISILFTNLVGNNRILSVCLLGENSKI